MGYLMIPVPEKHYGAVIRFLAQLQTDDAVRLLEWDNNALEALFRHMGNQNLPRLVSLLRKSSDPMMTEDVAETLKLGSTKDIGGLIGPTNRWAKNNGLPPLFCSSRRRQDGKLRRCLWLTTIS